MTTGKQFKHEQQSGLSVRFETANKRLVNSRKDKVQAKIQIKNLMKNMEARPIQIKSDSHQRSNVRKSVDKVDL